MPPIDWQAVKLEDLNEMLDNQQKPKVRDDLW